jgi:hypothetical protein
MYLLNHTNVGKYRNIVILGYLKEYNAVVTRLSLSHEQNKQT